MQKKHCSHSRRANGEGSIYYDKSKSSWRAMITLKSGKRIQKYSKDKETLQDWLNEQRLLVGRNLLIDTAGLTVGEWFDEYLETYAKPTVRPRTYDRYCSLLDRAEPIRKIKIKQLLPAHLQQLYNYLANDYAANTIKHIHFCISGAMRQATLNGLIFNNPCQNVKTPTARLPKIEIFTGEEIRKMIMASKNYPCEPVIIIAATTGMRLSEILGLSWENINLITNNNTLPSITIAQTVHRSFNSGLYFEECKNSSSHRKIEIPDETAKTLIRYQLETGRRTGLVFLNSVNHPYDSGYYSSRIFARIRKDADINLTKTFKTFRHTHASLLVADADITDQEVARRLGHSRLSTTLDIYSHSVPVNNRQLVNKISDLIFKRA